MVYNLENTDRSQLTGMANLPAVSAADVVDGKLYVVTQNQGLYIYQLED